MEIQLQEWASGKPEGGIDKTAFVLKGVKVLGLQSKHGYSYNALGLKAAVGLYEGLAIKAAGHPQPGQPMGVQYADKLGFLRNARFVDGQGIYGDVHLNPHQKLSEPLMWDAENDPNGVGLSHEAVATGGTKTPGGVIEGIKSVHALAVVTDPATTKGLFESASSLQTGGKGMELKDLTLDELKKTRPDLLEAGFKELQTTDQVAKQIEAMKTENASLKAKVGEFEIKEAIHARRTIVEKKIADAKLPAVMLTESFKTRLVEARDDAAIDAIIKDMTDLAKHLRESVNQPVSFPQTTGQPAGQVWDWRKEVTGKILKAS